MIDSDALARAMEANKKNLQEMRKQPSCHPDHVQALERLSKHRNCCWKQKGVPWNAAIKSLPR